MPKQWLNGPERCLLDKWDDARSLEDTMKSIREKYKELLGKVIERLQAKHKELDHTDTHTDSEGLHIGIGKSEWPLQKGDWMSGLWIGGVGIDNLTSEDKQAPYAMVLVNRSRKALDFERVERELRVAAKLILSKGNFRHMESAAFNTQAQMLYCLQESRHALLELLHGDGIVFVDCLVAHFDSMARFVPVIDRMFETGKRSRK